MIKGDLKTNLTVDMIREKLDDYNIFCYYLGSEIDFKKKYPSPFREKGVDNNPNLEFFKGTTGKILFQDWANGMIGDCFEYVMKLYNLNLQECLKKIDKDFNLGLYYKNDLTFKMKLIKVPDYQSQKQLIQIVQRDYWTKGEYRYWDNHHISLSELVENNIRPIDKLFINKREIVNIDGEIRFAYLYDSYLKIYSPYSPQFKWISNTPNNFISGFDDIKYKIYTGVQDKKLIITKSKKDEIILKKFFKDVCSTQNESNKSIDAEDMKTILSGYDRSNIFMAFDDDNAGRYNSRYYEDNYGFNSIYVKHLQYRDNTGNFKYIKDWGEFSYHFGLSEIKNHLQHKQLI